MVDHKLTIADYGPEPSITPSTASFQSAVTQPASGRWRVEMRIAWSELGGTATVGRSVGFEVSFTNGSSSSTGGALVHSVGVIHD